MMQSKRNQGFMQQSSLSSNRLKRLRSLRCRLGEPDLVSIQKITTYNTFLSNKRVVQSSQYFVTGANFITTAHISIFVKGQLPQVIQKNKQKIEYRVRVFIFDAFQRKNIQVQIKIPGSLEIRSYDMNGLTQIVQDSDIQRAYFSSVLRHLYKFPYHSSLRIFPQIGKYECLKCFIQKFVPFSTKNFIFHQLEDQTYYGRYNLALQILIEFLLKNKFWHLIQIMEKSLQKNFAIRGFVFKMEKKIILKQYKEILAATASVILYKKLPDAVIRKMKEIQLKCLISIKKKNQSKILSELLIKEGLSDYQLWEDIFRAHQSFLKDNQNSYMKIMNTCFSFFGEESSFKQKLHKQIYPEALLVTGESSQQRNEFISSQSQLSFLLDQNFLYKFSRINQFSQKLANIQKQKGTLDLLNSIQRHLKPNHYFEKYLVSQQKIRGWRKLLEIRSKCFWIQSDFNQQQIVQSKKVDFDQSFEFMNESLHMSTQKSQELRETRIQDELKVNIIYSQDDEQDNKSNESFDGNFSEISSTEKPKIAYLPPCSKRICTIGGGNRFLTQTQYKSYSNKILCHFQLEKLFHGLCQSLKIQIVTQNWLSKLNLQTVASYSKQKKQLLAIVLLKKAMLHKKLQRFRKCQETLRLIKKITNNVVINLVGYYELAELYLYHQNVKGVQIYMTQIIRILFQIGVKKYDIVPLWAQKMLVFIIQKHGANVVKTVNGPIRQILELWIQIGYP